LLWPHAAAADKIDEMAVKPVALLWLLLLVVGTARAAQIEIDAKFPGGNIVVDGVEGDTIKIHPDLRDTDGNWFYWAFRVRGAQGRTLKFVFTQQQPIGVRGPAVSVDEGVTWRWLGREGATNNQFKYTFGDGERSVMFSMGMPYTQANLDALLKRFADNPVLRVETLTASRKGRRVERLHIAVPDAKPSYRIFITARHHACEMMASYAIEGIIEAALADDEVGRWYRVSVELAIVPFVDKDGVEDGDQGKNRRPRDHNRDYSGTPVHPETAAIREWLPKWAEGKLVVALDLHCPTLRGPRNEVIYQVGRRDEGSWAQQQRFGAALRESNKGELPYDPANDLPFGKEWNVEKNFTQGESSTSWTARIAGVKLATTMELPYANASGAEVNQKSARAFGRDVAIALRAYVERDAK
jgi:hypothetical protein